MLELKESTECPNCKKKLDVVSAVDGYDRLPIENDITICSNCSAVLVYEKDLSLSELSDDQISNLPEELKSQINMAKDFLKRFKPNENSNLPN